MWKCCVAFNYVLLIVASFTDRYRNRVPIVVLLVHVVNKFNKTRISKICAHNFINILVSNRNMLASKWTKGSMNDMT